MLYMPKEGLDIPIDVAAKNKELVQRLESLFIFIAIITKNKKVLLKFFFFFKKLLLFTGQDS